MTTLQRMKSAPTIDAIERASRHALRRRLTPTARSVAWRTARTTTAMEATVMAGTDSRKKGVSPTFSTITASMPALSRRAASASA